MADLHIIPLKCVDMKNKNCFKPVPVILYFLVSLLFSCFIAPIDTFASYSVEIHLNLLYILSYFVALGAV